MKLSNMIRWTVLAACSREYSIFNERSKSKITMSIFLINPSKPYLVIFMFYQAHFPPTTCRPCSLLALMMIFLRNTLSQWTIKFLVIKSYQLAWPEGNYSHVFFFLKLSQSLSIRLILIPSSSFSTIKTWILLKIECWVWVFIRMTGILLLCLMCMLKFNQ
jgi:Zn-dependent protease with chaperone function